MEEKYIWDLTHIYNSKEDVYKSIEEAYNLLEKIKVYKGKLKDNNDNIFNVFSIYEKILCLIEKIYGYAMLEFHRDMSNLDAMKLYKKSENLLTESIKIEDKVFEISSVLMGVPHTIVFVEELSKADVYKYGPLLEKNKIFPKNTNVNFVKIEDEENISVYTWERGCGYTLGCGTGMTASVIISNLLNKSK